MIDTRYFNRHEATIPSGFSSYSLWWDWNCWSSWFAQFKPHVYEPIEDEM